MSILLNPDMLERELIRRFYFEIVAGSGVNPEGAQYYNGKWYAPNYGCDTFSNMLDYIKGLQKQCQLEGRDKCQ